ncbi:MAG: stage II sporulation protein P [Eubacteriales bacterium]
MEEKERIDLFGDYKRLPDGGRRSVVARAGRTGAAFFSTIALGVAMFAVIFMICCFAGGLAGTTWQPGIDEPSDTHDNAGNTPPGTQDATGDTETDTLVTDGGADRSFLDIIRSLIDVLSGKKETGVQEDETTDSGTNADTQPVYVDPDNLYYFDYSQVPPGNSPIVPMDMSLVSYGETYFFNETAYAPKISALLNSKDAIPAFDFLGAAIYPVGNPVVLIIHTHGTEAYSKEGSISYSEADGEFARSSDITQNVVAVGKVIADVLNENGVRTLHCTTMHDLESYKDSYIRAAATIREYLANYPSIQYVIDVHRDSITTSDGSIIRPVMLADGKACAQVMCVVGSDYNGADYDNWQNNLALALKLRSVLNERYGNMCRPVYLRSSAYNQQYAPMTMLLEVGTSGNSLSEAKEAARLVAQALADIIKRKAG